MNKSQFATPRCPGSLKDGFATYNSATLRGLFNGHRVFHVLPEAPQGIKWADAQIHSNHFGNQQWYRMQLEKNILKPKANGGWLLKTVSSGAGNVQFPYEQAANEHLCLQLAAQVYELECVPNALIFFPKGQPALICKYLGTHLPQKNYLPGYIDFGILLENSFKELTNRVSKDYSYQSLALLIDKYVAASLIVKERFFSQVIFSWLIANATAHMQNFGLVRTSRGDYDLAPLQHQMCTVIHEPGPEIAPPGGLYKGDKESPEFREYGHYTRNEFTSFGRRIGLFPARIEKILDGFVAGMIPASELIDKAFLPEEVKNLFRYNFMERLFRLK